MAEDIYATLQTNFGAITLKLFPNHAPQTVQNFVDLAEGKKFYDGTIFHRVISGFMIQGGDPTGTGRGGPGYTFADELHPDLTFNKPYVLGMANAGPNTNGSQFFITVEPHSHLNGKYTIFGEVADDASSEIVQKISNTATGPMDKPTQDVTLESVTIERR